MTKRFLRKKDMLYKVMSNQWGKHNLYYMNFENMVRYMRGGQRKAIVEDKDGKLCDHENGAFAEWIQEFYKEWKDEYIERLLLNTDE